MMEHVGKIIKVTGGPYQSLRGPVTWNDKTYLRFTPFGSDPLASIQIPIVSQAHPYIEEEEEAKPTKIEDTIPDGSHLCATCRLTVMWPGDGPTCSLCRFRF